MTIPQELRDAPQWVVWRYEHRGGKPTKVPYRVDGRRASTTEPADRVTFDEANAAREHFDGVGFVFTEDDDWVGVDLDGCLDDHGATRPWATEILERVPGYVDISPSKKGIKIFCRGTFPTSRGRRVKLTPDGEQGIEIYKTGRYFTVTGDSIGEANLLDASEGLSWLASRHFPAATPQNTPVCLREPTRAVERARAFARKHGPAIAGNRGHDHTFHLACVLRVGFNLDRSDAHAILSEWNTSCEPPWSDRELQHKLDSAEAEGHRTGEWGHMFADDANFEPVDQTEYDVYLDDLLANIQSRLNTDFPARLYHVPGLVADVAEWITTQNPRPNQLLSLVAALALQSVIVARKVKDVTGARSNLFLVGLAPSGGGKQAPQDAIEIILGQTGQSDLFSGEVASDSALAQDLTLSPAKLFIWDEFGRFLAKTQEKKGGVHLHAVQESLLKLWGAAKKPLWKAKSLADSRFNREIPFPCVSFLGFSVPSHFWGGLEECHLDDGFAARLIVIDSGDLVESRTPIEAPPPPSVLDRVAWWRDFNPGGNLAQHGDPDPMLIHSTPEAEEVFTDLTLTAENHDHPLWSRAIEKARRLAIVYACSRDYETPIIDKDAAEWARDFVTWTTIAFISKVADEVTGGEVFQAKRQRVLKLVREKSKNRHECTRSQLLKATKWRARELDEILDTLQAADQIVELWSGEGSAKKRVYKAT